MTILVFIMCIFNCWLLARIIATEHSKYNDYKDICKDALIISALNLTVFTAIAAMYAP